MEKIPNYKNLHERLQEEKEYFYKLLEKIRNNLTIPQFKELQKYLQIYQELADARFHVIYVNNNNLEKEIHTAKKSCETHIVKMLDSFLSEDEIDYTMHIFQNWIIKGEPAY